MATVSLESTIRDLVDRGASRHPELRTRLEHASLIVLFRTVSPRIDGTWSVGSECDPATTYTVDLNSSDAYCTCRDSQYHLGAECKHSLAVVMLSRALIGLERHTIFDAAPTSPMPRMVAVGGRMPRAERED
jgi:hypothetical protein